MVPTLRVLIGVVSSALAFAVTTAAPAAADEHDYLRLLQPKYIYLSAQQLLDEGHKVCRVLSAGTISPDATTMVQKDLTVSLATAEDIVDTAAVQLGC